jgi:hypothetical protein
VNTQIEQGDKQDCVIEEKIGSVALAEKHVFFSFIFGKLFSIYYAVSEIPCIICTREIATTET